MGVIDNALQHVRHTLDTIDSNPRQSARDAFAMYEQAWGVLSFIRFLAHYTETRVTTEQSEAYVFLEDLVLREREVAWKRIAQERQQ